MKTAALRALGLLALVAVAAAGGFYLYRHQAAPETAPPAGASSGGPATASRPAGHEAVIGQTRPAFSLPDLAGRERHISEWDGQVVVVNFWATWCPPCLKEIPEFIDLQARYGGQGVQFIGIALQKPADVVDFAREHGMNYPVLAGEMPVVRVAEDYGNDIGALPYTAVLDRDGTIVFTRQGRVNRAEMEKVIRPLL